MLFFLFSSLSLVLIVFLASLLWRRRTKSIEVDDAGNASRVEDLRILKDRHKTASVLSDLVDKDGAGTWPPKSNHDSWPLALRPYKDIYLELVEHLSVAEASLDDEINRERIDKFRSLMRKRLSEKINIAQVVGIMNAVEAGNWDIFPRDAYNGFYCCIAVSRHAYRWGTMPVVKVAQTEKVVDFPPELDAAWPYMQKNFGMTAESGNNTANVLHNFNEQGERVYKINIGMSDVVRSSEEAFFRMFYDLEVLAFPIYYELVRAVITFDEGDKLACGNHLENVTFRLRHLLKVFYQNLTEARVSQTVWLSYVQGFQGWGVGRMVDGEFIKYDGLSGNHVLFFQALDAFLGMETYLTPENLIRYIPVNQRELCNVFREHCFRSKLKEEPDMKIEEEIKKIVNHLKVFRSAHRTRVMPYLKHPAPERLVMTAGKSVLQSNASQALEDSLKPLDDMMANRLRQTA